MNSKRVWTAVFLAVITLVTHAGGQISPESPVPVEAQPLAGNIRRVIQALDFLGAPLATSLLDRLRTADRKLDSDDLQRLLDPSVLLVVEINPEGRVKLRRGAAKAQLQQSAFTPALLKVINHSAVTAELRLISPQAGQVYAGMSPLSAERMQRTHLNETAVRTVDFGRFLELEMYSRPPLAANLSGLEVEYAIALVYSSEPGRREATLGIEAGQGNQDLGFRSEVPILFDVRPAVKVRLKVREADGQPTVARLTFRDAAGHVFPPQAKRLAPDFYFQPQIYRADGSTVLLPPGPITLEYTRGPEYQRLERQINVPAASSWGLDVKPERWIDPAAFGFYSGDHHIHGAGCAHYTSPTEGVTPEDMFLQVRGEGLNVGCILTWGPCFDYQRRFFTPTVSQLSTPMTVMKYDLEISGFGSEALGHVCLLHLKTQTYPGSDGTKTKGWPTWTTPVMRWTKQQGGVAGYAHSGSGLEIDARAASKRLLQRWDANQDGVLVPAETAAAVLPLEFDQMDTDHDHALTESELISAHERAAERLPNFAVPEMNGVGAMEICVSTVAGACDFISAMDTPRIAEWNMWYHILNCGFPLRASGETDFPCMSGERVGQGRVYVQLGKVRQLDFGAWCDALAKGRSYVSDGFAHALLFEVNGISPGFGAVQLERAGPVAVRARVAFAPETPLTVAQGTLIPPGGRRFAGDTVTLHGPRRDEMARGGERLVELVFNGAVVASEKVAADGKTHDLNLSAVCNQSGWLALREFPELHTNPVDVLIQGKPIRASRRSALWCIETIDQLWRKRAKNISPGEREEARRAFELAKAKFQQIAAESPAGS